MPILGMTTTPITDIGNSVPIIARLYKGAKRTEEDIAKKRPAKELPHFRVEFEPQFERFAPLFFEMYGDKPTELCGVGIGSDVTDNALTAYYREWGKSGLIRECDGANITREYSPDAGQVVRLGQTPCLRQQNKSCDCKQEGSVNFLIPAFSERIGVLGVFRLTTHSRVDIREIYKTLMVTQMIYGRLFGIPFILSRQLDEIPYFDKDDKKRKTARKYFVKLRVDEAYVRAGLASRLSAGGSAPQLVNPTTHAPSLPSGDAPRPITWIATNGNMERILAWAHGWFDLEADEVFKAFRCDDPTITDLRDYAGDANRIRACIIAYVSGGEVSKVYEHCNNSEIIPKPTANAVSRMAQQMLAEWASEYASDDSLDEISNN